MILHSFLMEQKSFHTLLYIHTIIEIKRTNQTQRNGYSELLHNAIYSSYLF